MTEEEKPRSAAQALARVFEVKPREKKEKP